jgi:hypothetical protein
MAVILSKNFDINNITFSKPAVLKSGAKQAYVNYNGGKLILQTPAKITLPFGVSEFKADDKSPLPGVFSLDLSFRDKETNPAMQQLYNAMAALDELMIDTAVERSTEWFGKAKKRDVIEEELYTRTVRRSKDDKYPPTMKLKLPQKDGVFDAKFYDENRSQFVDFDIKKILPRNSVVTCIIQCAGVWFAAGKFGLSWRAVQVMIHSKPQELGDFGFAADDGLELNVASSVTNAVMPEDVNDDEAFAEAPEKISKEATPKEPANTPAEDDLDEEMEPEAIPKKPLVKKKVVAKK